jgi:hypothetical protein
VESGILTLDTNNQVVSIFKNSNLLLKHCDQTKSHKIAHMRPENTVVSKLQMPKIKSNDIIHLQCD